MKPNDVYHRYAYIKMVNKDKWQYCVNEKNEPFIFNDFEKADDQVSQVKELYQGREVYFIKETMVVLAGVKTGAKNG